MKRILANPGRKKAKVSLLMTTAEIRQMVGRGMTGKIILNDGSATAVGQISLYNGKSIKIHEPSGVKGQPSISLHELSTVRRIDPISPLAR